MKLKVLGMILVLALIGCNKQKKAGNDHTYSINVGSTPPTINPLGSATVGASTIAGYCLDGLLFSDPDTNEWKPNIAESWTVSDDGLVFEFKIRGGIKWHDGKPLTVEDIKFSYDVIFTDTYDTIRIRPYYENFSKVEIINKNTIRFTAKTKYHQNLAVLGSGGFLSILPKHIYENPSKEEKKELNKTIIGSGAFILKEFSRGKRVVLERNPNWFGRKVDHLKKTYNYDRVIVRFIKESDIALESLKKGKIDFMGLTPEQFMKKTDGKGWGEKYHKVKTKNKSVKGYGFIGWNLRNPLFQNRNIRIALSHLVNRQLMIDKFTFGLSTHATGPIYKQNPYANPNVKPILFNPKKALSILRSEGWKDTDDDQVLDKTIKGKKRKLSFTLLMPNKDFEKYLTIFKEDAKKAGVDIKLKLIEWSSFIKLLDERKFEAVMLSWGGGSIEWDPKQIWHSQSIKGGSNFIGYSNSEVDSLIDQARAELDKEKRKVILHKVYKLIADDAPYVFLFNRKYELYAHTDRMKKEKETYVYEIGTEYWTIKEP